MGVIRVNIVVSKYRTKWKQIQKTSLVPEQSPVVPHTTNL